MLNYHLKIVKEKFVTSIGRSDEFYVNLLIDRSIYRSMCTHIVSRCDLHSGAGPLRGMAAHLQGVTLTRARSRKRARRVAGVVI